MGTRLPTMASASLCSLRPTTATPWATRGPSSHSTVGTWRPNLQLMKVTHFIAKNFLISFCSHVHFVFSCFAPQREAYGLCQLSTQPVWIVSGPSEDFSDYKYQTADKLLCVLWSNLVLVWFVKHCKYRTPRPACNPLPRLKRSNTSTLPQRQSVQSQVHDRIQVTFIFKLWSMKLYLVIMKDMCQYVEQERTIMNYDKSINTCKLQLSINFICSYWRPRLPVWEALRVYSIYWEFADDIQERSCDLWFAYYLSPIRWAL